MGWAFLIGIGAFLFYKLVIRFFIDMKRENEMNLIALPPFVQDLISRRKADELAILIEDSRLEGNFSFANQILQAIDSKGVVFATKVDRIRNKIRKERGMDPLKWK